MDSSSENGGSDSADMDLSDGYSRDEPDTQQASSKRKLTDLPVNNSAAAKRAKTDTNSLTVIEEMALSSSASHPVEDHTSTLPTTSSHLDRDHTQLLPDAIVQRILVLLPPAMLFRCTRVCKRFKHVLEDFKNIPVRPRRKGDALLQLVDSETIWTSSRRSTYPSLPRPLDGFTEAQMLRLLTQRACTKCKQHFPRITATHALNGGPGVDGIRVIWPFRLAACGPCLVQLSITEIDLLKERRMQDGSVLPAGILRRGLPYAFLSRDWHIVDEVNARTNSNQGISKVFLREDNDSIIVDYHRAKSLGQGAADEWRKGLDNKGKEAMNDSARWSRWEDLLPIGTDPAKHMMELDPSSFSSPSIPASTQPLAASTQPLVQPVHAPTFSQSVQQPRDYRHVPASASKEHQSARQPRDPREVQEIIRQRREEIQRRCMSLVPPLEPAVLQYNSAYNAALQISMPLSDMAWEQLRPRIEEGRETAERIHYEKSQQMAVMGAAMPTSLARSHYPLTHFDKEVDHDWEEARAPLRRTLSDIADELINSKWLRTRFDQNSAAVFAAEVLTHVYQQCNQAAGSQQHDTELALDDLRWVFDQKIRAVAEEHCRELLACSGCFADNSEIRWFAFEGLIQHYGAKHTDEFSKGNIVVHWQSAPWPHEAPYITDLRQILQPEPGRRTIRGTRHSHRPQAIQDRTIHQNKLLSDYPMFASDSTSINIASKPESPVSDEVHLAKLGGDAAEVWDKLAGVENLLDSIRVQTVLQVVHARYRQYFKSSMPLELLTKALALDPLLAGLKSAKLLGCRLCAPTLEGTGSSYYARLENKKLHNLNNLLNHFKLVHLSRQRDPATWINLVDLPDKEQVYALLETPGMNDEKLALVAEAFPGVFPAPLPLIGTIPKLEEDSGLARRLVDKQLDKSSNKSKKKKKGHNNGNGDAQAARTREYDPHHAILPDRARRDNTALDLSKFDTDAARPARPAPIAAPAANLGHDLITPETLAAINSLQLAAAAAAAAPPAPPAMPQPSQSERLPSPYATPAQAPAAVSSQPAAVPDITAIIAAFNARQAVPTPPAYTTFTPQSPLRAVPTMPVYTTHAQPLPGTTAPLQCFTTLAYAAANYAPTASAAPAPSFGNWQPDAYAQPQYSVSPYQPVQYQPAPVYNNGQDLMAALMQNSRAYQVGNHHNSPVHYEPARPSAPPFRYAQNSPVYQPQPMYQANYNQQTPAAVEYAYPTGYAYPVARAQSIQYAPPARAPQAHETHQQPVSRLYVDQHGRYIDEHGRRVELVPIDQ